LVALVHGELPLGAALVVEGHLDLVGRAGWIEKDWIGKLAADLAF
jgi:hypothetical protein